MPSITTASTTASATAAPARRICRIKVRAFYRFRVRRPRYRHAEIAYNESDGIKHLGRLFQPYRSKNPVSYNAPFLEADRL
jgi:hypothetical protein